MTKRIAASLAALFVAACAPTAAPLPMVAKTEPATEPKLEDLERELAALNARLEADNARLRAEVDEQDANIAALRRSVDAAGAGSAPSRIAVASEGIVVISEGSKDGIIVGDRVEFVLTDGSRVAHLVDDVYANYTSVRFEPEVAARIDRSRPWRVLR